MLSFLDRKRTFLHHMPLPCVRLSLEEGIFPADVAIQGNCIVFARCWDHEERWRLYSPTWLDLQKHLADHPESADADSLFIEGVYLCFHETIPEYRLIIGT